jgi:hypothetical protein
VSNHGEDEIKATFAGGSEQGITVEPAFAMPETLVSQTSVLEPVLPLAVNTSERLEAGLDPSVPGGPVEHVAPAAVETVFLAPANLEPETDITAKLKVGPETSPPSGPVEHVAPEAVETIFLPSANPEAANPEADPEVAEDTPTATGNNSEQDEPSAEPNAATKPKKKKKKKSKK